MFPIKVGARGYCSLIVKSCFLRLGLSNKLVRSTLKSLSLISIKTSFQIWLSRDNKDWSNPEISCPGPYISKPSIHTVAQQTNKQTSNPSLQNYTNTSRFPTKSPSSAPSKVSSSLSSAVLSTGCFSPGIKQKQNRRGIINKGNTCYVSVILQCLSVLPDLWPSNPQNNSPFILSLNKMLSHLHSCKSHLDPSSFLKSLENVLIKGCC